MKLRPIPSYLASLFATASLFAAPEVNLQPLKAISPVQIQRFENTKARRFVDGGEAHAGRSPFIAHGNRAQRARKIGGMISKNANWC